MKSFTAVVDEIDEFIKKNKQQRQENLKKIKNSFK